MNNSLLNPNTVHHVNTPWNNWLEHHSRRRTPRTLRVLIPAPPIDEGGYGDYHMPMFDELVDVASNEYLETQINIMKDEVDRLNEQISQLECAYRTKNKSRKRKVRHDEIVHILEDERRKRSRGNGFIPGFYTDM